jgi:2,3-bisphosphoglycerate-dependent phosphoglycerate mutase
MINTAVFAMGIIIILRHGESTANAEGLLSDGLEDAPLTEKGKEEVKSVVKQLKKIKISKIYSSPVIRAIQTAQIVADEFGLDVVIERTICERKFGEANGKPRHDGMWRYELPKSVLDTVETWNDYTARITSFMNTLAESDETVVVAAHDGTGKALIAKLMDLDETSAFGIKAPNASMSIFKRRGNDFEIIAIGAPILDEKLLSKIS